MLEGGKCCLKKGKRKVEAGASHVWKGGKKKMV